MSGYEEFSNDWRHMLASENHRTGGDPSFLFEILEGIVQKRAWEYLTDGNGDPIGSLRRLIEAPPPVGAGMPAEKVLALLEVEHRYEYGSADWRDRMAALRDTVRRELVDDNPNMAWIDMSDMETAAQDIIRELGRDGALELRDRLERYWLERDML